MRYLDQLPGAARTVLFALLPVAATGGGRALPVMLGVAGVLAFQPSHLRQAIEKRPLPIVFLLLAVAWAATSSLWSSDPNHTQAVRLVSTVGLGLVFAAAAVTPTERRLTRSAGAAAFVVLSALLAIEALWNMPLNRVLGGGVEDWIIERAPGRGATILLGLAWPVAASLVSRRGSGAKAAAVLALGVAGALAAQFHDFGNLAAFVLGIVAFAAGLAAPALALRAVTIGLALWTIASPFLTPVLFSNQQMIDLLPYSWAVRASVWRYVCGRIGEQPWFGHGLDASRTVTDMINVRGQIQHAIPLHPHSASLQIWFETGAVGAILVASGLVLTGSVLARSLAADRPKAAAACAALAAIGVSANVSYGLWQEWWDASMLLTAALVGAVSTATPARSAVY